MAAKTEAPPPAPEAAPATPAAPPAPTRGIKMWIPAIAAIVLAPVTCWAVAQYVLIPQLKKGLTLELEADASSATGVSTGGTATTAGAHGKAGAKAPEPVVLNTYKFENVVVNLAGTMGTRYLKTTFLVGGPQADIVARFEAARPQLLDVTISVLSSLSLGELEEPGAKNVIREKLVNSYNQVLGQRVADQVYFSEFVVQ